MHDLRLSDVTGRWRLIALTSEPAAAELEFIHLQLFGCFNDKLVGGINGISMNTLYWNIWRLDEAPTLHQLTSVWVLCHTFTITHCTFKLVFLLTPMTATDTTDTNISLTHINVPKAALTQLLCQGQFFPGHLPSVTPEAQGERGGVDTGRGQVITQPIIIFWWWRSMEPKRVVVVECRDEGVLGWKN